MLHQHPEAGTCCALGRRTAGAEQDGEQREWALSYCTFHTRLLLLPL